MDNYNSEEFYSADGQNPQEEYYAQQEGYYDQQIPVQPMYYYVEPDTAQAPVKKSSAGRWKKRIDVDAVVIVSLLIALVVVVFFAVKAGRSGTSIFEIEVPELTLDSVISTTVAPTVPEPSVQTEPAEPTTPPALSATQIPSTVVTKPPETVPAAASTEPVTTADPKQEILDAVSAAINSLKDPAASFKGTKTQNISIKLTECSVAVLVDPANVVLDYFAGEETFEFDFTNGKAIDPETGEEITSSMAIPPTDKPFTLTLEGIAEATSEQVGDKTVYTIKVVSESSNLASPRPPHHNAACDTLDFSAFELPMGEITKADFEYPGAVITVTVGADGRIVEYHENLPMKGVGEGKLGITASGSMEGSIDEKWSIEWK